MSVPNIESLQSDQVVGLDEQRRASEFFRLQLHVGFVDTVYGANPDPVHYPKI
jgi:hypothetical protein